MITDMVSAPVVGREQERAVVDALLAARSGALLLCGEPGIGKTVLWEQGVRGAEEGGWTVLVHRSARAETAFAFAGLSDLLAPVVDEALDGLPAPRRRALEVALLLAEPQDGRAPDVRAIGLALLDVLRALAAQGPVLLALDDVQWLDVSSAAVLSVAVRRLGDEPVAVLGTMRTEAGAVVPEALARMPLERLTLEPLDLAAVHRLLRDRLALELPRPQLARIHRAAGGNPYFALELARDGGEHVPDSLREVLGHRLDRLSPDVLAMLLDAAALATPTVQLVDGHAALAVVVDEGIVRLDGDRIRFAHPLLASLVYDRALPWDRRAAHARLAGLVTDLEERARHLSLAAGDEVHAGLAAQLEQAGRRAANRGAPAAAAELLELAVRHSPTQERGDRLQTAAGFHHVSGDLRRALSIYESLLDDLPRGPRRAAVLYAIGRVQLANAPERLASCEQALEEVGDDDALAAHILALIAITCWMLGETAKGLAAARDGLQRAERVGDPPLVAMALANAGCLETWLLDVTPGLLQRGADIEQGLDDLLTFHDSPSFHLGLRRSLYDDLDGARSVMQDVVKSAQRRGDEHTRGFGLLILIDAARQAGRVTAALEHADTARAIVEQMGDPQLLHMHAFITTTALIDAGRLAQARELAEEGLAVARAMGGGTGVAIIRGQLGREALIRGDLDAAWAHLDGQPQALVRQGHLHPGNMMWDDAVETLIALGRLDEAGALLAQFDDLAARSSRWARAAAARCHALLALALGDDAGAVAACDRALAEEGGTYPIERGRILTTLGAAHRHARRTRAAREALGAAVELLDGIDAVSWRDAAAAELGRVSGRRAHGDELTPAEQRVAELAAEGRQNKEIAAELFLSVATVEAHLSRVYRKLGLRSRTELARALGQPTKAQP
jgi:DNA-binding CsgD family transcriptional regulator